MAPCGSGELGITLINRGSRIGCAVALVAPGGVGELSGLCVGDVVLAADLTPTSTPTSTPTRTLTLALTLTLIPNNEPQPLTLTPSPNQVLAVDGSVISETVSMCNAISAASGSRLGGMSGQHNSPTHGHTWPHITTAAHSCLRHLASAARPGPPPPGCSWVAAAC